MTSEVDRIVDTFPIAELSIMMGSPPTMVRNSIRRSVVTVLTEGGSIDDMRSAAWGAARKANRTNRDT